ncbi:hypothetical protein [Treponema zioleckii]|uniref:hypothetical protein n=1 Tax=Treponema zioleckii TaxID=331680 RepID=UPI00168B20DE|nr:hypothetical protein [Treponema zioleckii]
MNQIKSLANEIFSRFGNVKRARGYFLYTEKGVRLTDMFLEGGKAILGWGHEGTGAFTIFKNALERGACGSFQTCFENQLHRAVCELLGLRTNFFFNDKNKALAAAKEISSAEPFFYFPWREENSKLDESDCVIFQPTLPWCEDFFVLAVKSTLNIEENIKKSLSENEVIIPPPLQAALARSIYDLIKQLQVREEKNWFAYDTVLTKYWTRNGPWLFPKVPKEKYEDFVSHCLECALVVSPVYEIPSIVPAGVDKGNFTKLKNSPFVF